MDKIIYSAEKVKISILHRFLRYNGKSKKDFNGKEKYTLFDKLSEVEKIKYLTGIELNKHELPVTILKISPEYWIIHTTENILCARNNEVTIIGYKDIEKIIGFNMKNNKEYYRIVIQNGMETIYLKAEGFMAFFEIQLINKTIMKLEIPTGNDLYTFWNFTMRLGHLKRFEIKEYIA